MWINERVKRANIPPPGWLAECTVITIIERWQQIFAAGFGYALH
jgi:hypothetical protein